MVSCLILPWIEFGILTVTSFTVFIAKEAPRYPTGFASGLGLTVAAIPLLMLCTFLFWRHNKKIDARIAAGEVLNDQVDYKYVL